MSFTIPHLSRKQRAEDSTTERNRTERARVLTFGDWSVNYTMHNGSASRVTGVTTTPANRARLGNDEGELFADLLRSWAHHDGLSVLEALTFDDATQSARDA